MIRCELGPEPSRFDADVRQPGRRWLDRNPHVRQPRPLWRAVVRELAAAFHERCAYLAIRILDGQVDHFIPCSEDRDLAYEWTNYRYCDPSINSRKSRTRSGELLDPCSIDDAWFEVLLPSLQVSVTERCPPALRARAESTLVRLGIRDGEQMIRKRAEWLRLYEGLGERGQALLEFLDHEDPMLARALRKRDTPP